MRFATASLLLASLGFTACEYDPALDVDAEEDLGVEVLAAAGDLSTTPEWRFIPTLLPSLQVHVCDVKDAGTNDWVGVRFQVGTPTTKVVGGKTVIDKRPGIKQFLLDLPGNDFERNGTYTFYFSDFGSVPGGLAQMGDLKNFEIFKWGDDRLCIDRAALFMQGTKVWEFDSDNVASGTHLHPQGKGPAYIDLDDEKSDAPSNRVRFSDQTAKYNDRSTHGKIELKVLTCSSANSGTNADVRAKWSHDGIAEMPVYLDKNKHDDFEEGDWNTYTLSGYEAIHKIDYLRIESQGTDGLCVDAVQLFANGKLVFQDFTNHTFDNTAEDDWDGFDYAINDVVETGSHTGHLGKPISTTPVAKALDEKIAATPLGNHAFCEPPARFPWQHLRGIMAIEAGQAFRSNGKATWGDSGYINITKKDNDSAHAKLRFELDSPGIGNGVAWLDMDLDVGCGDPKPEDNKDETKLMIVPSHRDLDTDLPALGAALNWFNDKLLGNDDFRVKIRAAIPMDPRWFSTNNACPGRVVEADGDIKLTWDEFAGKPKNGMCFADSSLWSTF